MQRVKLMNGVDTIHHDADLSSYFDALASGGVYNGLDVAVSGSSLTIQPGRAIVPCERNTGERILAVFISDEVTTVDMANGWLVAQVRQENIDNKWENNEQGSHMSDVKVVSEKPDHNVVVLAKIEGGAVVDGSQDKVSLSDKALAESAIFDALVKHVHKMQEDMDNYQVWSHDHNMSEVAGLAQALAGKSDEWHTHPASDITGLDEAMSGKADKSELMYTKVQDIRGHNYLPNDAIYKDHHIHQGFVEASTIWIPHYSEPRAHLETINKWNEENLANKITQIAHNSDKIFIRQNTSENAWWSWGEIPVSGVSHTLDLIAKHDGRAELNLCSENQWWWVLYVWQEKNYGWGIEYDGSNMPWGSGAGSDHTALFRRNNGSDHWVAKWRYNADAFIMKAPRKDWSQENRGDALTRKDYVNSMIYENSNNDTKIRTKWGHDLIHLANDKKVYIGHLQPWAINTFIISSQAHQNDASSRLNWLPNYSIIPTIDTNGDLIRYTKDGNGKKRIMKLRTTWYTYVNPL